MDVRRSENTIIGSSVTAWRPDIPAITEVFHATYRRHAYPVHTHTEWTLLIIDDGVLHFDVGRQHHGTVRSQVVLLPPHVPHDGRTAAPQGFRKRVVYLAEEVLDTDLIGRAADRPNLADPRLWDRIDRLHDALAHPADALEGESRLALIVERLDHQLRRDIGRRRPCTTDPGLADRLRALLDEHVSDGMPLDQAARLLQSTPNQLVRTFARRFSIPPHLYLTGRRVELARRLLLSGQPASAVAVAVGFYDQSHLTRHFKRMLGVGPGYYARLSRGVDHARNVQDGGFGARDHPG